MNEDDLMVDGNEGRLILLVHYNNLKSYLKRYPTNKILFKFLGLYKYLRAI